MSPNPSNSSSSPGSFLPPTFPPPYRLSNDYDIDIVHGLIYVKASKMRAFDRLNANGYLYGTVSGIPYLTHKIIYFWATGVIPSGIRHIDTNKTNNRLDNLEPQTYTIKELSERQKSNQIRTNQLKSEYEREIPVSSIDEQYTPPRKIEKLITNELIIDNNYTTKRTKKGNWSLFYCGKHEGYFDTYLLVEKYIQEKNRKQ